MSKADFYCIPAKARKVYAPRRHQQLAAPPEAERSKPERRRLHLLPWSIRGSSAGR